MCCGRTNSARGGAVNRKYSFSKVSHVPLTVICSKSCSVNGSLLLEFPMTETPVYLSKLLLFFLDDTWVDFETSCNPPGPANRCRRFCKAWIERSNPLSSSSLSKKEGTTVDDRFGDFFVFFPRANSMEGNRPRFLEELEPSNEMKSCSKVG